MQRVLEFVLLLDYGEFMLSPVLSEILSLDPIKYHLRIVFLTSRHEFPFDMTRSLEFALFRTFCAPRISSLLRKTGEFRRRPQKRYDDTDILVSEMMEWGYDSARGRAALERMNGFHSRFKIANEDFLYVLSTFVFEPIRWNERFGWRLMTQHERLAMFEFWRQVGMRMGIQDIPSSYSEFERYNRDYEKREFVYSDSNHEIGVATRELFASWFPSPLRPLVRKSIYALMDDVLIEAFGFPKPSPIMRNLIERTLRTRARLLRYLPHRARAKPFLRTAMMKHRSYPDGYTLEKLGPENN